MPAPAVGLVVGFDVGGVVFAAEDSWRGRLAGFLRLGGRRRFGRLIRIGLASALGVKETYVLMKISPSAVVPASLWISSRNLRSWPSHWAP